MPEPDVDLAHQPAVAMFLIVAVVAALIATVINLRNVRLWLLRAAGKRAAGVVTRIEMVTGPAGPALRRPLVAFTTGDGREIITAPVVYRARTALREGSAVTVSYALRDPNRIVVHGYDFRTREPLYAALGLAVAIGISTAYFHL
jgi:hypothetical protein